METLRIDLKPLLADAAAGRPIAAPPGLSDTDLLIAVTMAAVRETAGDLELLQSIPARDDDQFGDRPRPAGVTHLGAWFYSASHRIAYAVHTPTWAGPTADPEHWSGADGWTALLRDHLHGDFHAGRGWSPVNAVAMPVRRPFDEPGLRVVPLLAVWAPVTGPTSQRPAGGQPGDDWFAETMTASVQAGRPHVVAVRVFSAAAYLRRLTATGNRRFDVTAVDRRPALVSPSPW